MGVIHKVPSIELGCDGSWYATPLPERWSLSPSTYLVDFSSGNHDTKWMVSIQRFCKNIELARVLVKQHIHFWRIIISLVGEKSNRGRYIGQIHCAIWMSYHVSIMYMPCMTCNGYLYAASLHVIYTNMVVLCRSSAEFFTVYNLMNLMKRRNCACRLPPNCQTLYSYCIHYKWS